MNFLLFLPVLSLLIPPYIFGLIFAVLLSAGLCALVHHWKKQQGIQLRPKLCRKELLSAAVPIAICAISFPDRWSASGKVHLVARLLHLPTNSLLCLAAVILAPLALPGTMLLFSIIRRIRHLLNQRFPSLLSNDLWLLFLLLESVMINCSCMTDFSTGPLFYASPLGFLLSFSLFFTINLPLYLLCRPRIAMIVSGSLSAVFSVINHYVILFHGSPLFFHELFNAATAMNVMQEYRITPDLTVLLILLYFIAEWIFCILPCPTVAPPRNLPHRRILPVCLPVISVLYVVLSIIFMINPLGWDWETSVRMSGFVPCMIGDTLQTMHPFRKPEGYEEQLRAMNIPSSEAPEPTEQLPDIIFILNESFYDPSVLAALDADTDYMAPFYGIDGATYGHCLIPLGGTGTNSSEFELLTSHSRSLLGQSTPFWVVDFTKSRDSIVRYLHAFGYVTAAMHCEPPTNYNRNRAYADMEFDSIYLGADAFPEKEFNGNRPQLDSGNYRYLIQSYEAAGDSPRFMYLLTFQNHGGYEQNPPELDTVHSLRDWGRSDDDMDEFLSSIALSASAFRELTEYFAASERPVIVCMVGDHAPAFITDIASDRTDDPKEPEMLRHSVPYVIWSNFDATPKGVSEWASLTDLAPLVLEAAGIPLSPYYQTILQLHNLLPMRSSGDLYRDPNGNIPDELPQDAAELLDRYYCMEYNALNAGKDYKEAFFLPAAP